MAFDPMPSGGSGPHEPFCTSCNEPIVEGQRSIRVDFKKDPHGHDGLSGLYHEECGKPFASIARVMNMDWFGRF